MAFRDYVTCMRLAFVLEHFRPGAGGAEGYAVAVADGLARRGHEVHVVARDGAAMPGLCFHPTPTGSLAAASANLDALVIDWGLRVPADLHRLGGGVSQVFHRYNRLSRGPCGRWLARARVMLSPQKRREMRREEQLLAAPRGRLLAVSEFVACQVREVVPAAASRLVVLHNGVDTARFNPPDAAARRARRRAELGFTPEQVVFLFLAHNPRLKNAALLYRVFRALHPRLPNLRLLALGKHRPGPAAPWLVHAGTVSDPVDAYLAADTLLHPTFYDACANVALEAAAAGLPVVSSDLNGSAELFTQDQDGLVLPVAFHPRPEVDAQWSQAVERLAGDAAYRHRLGSAARDLAARHTLDRYLDQFEALLTPAAP
jgi:UDP-glucose:(heptosyl)LPS alpha-1,3-glucosyltransferase